jgi:hypothetical protein
MNRWVQVLRAKDSRISATSSLRSSRNISFKFMEPTEHLCVDENSFCAAVPLGPMLCAVSKTCMLMASLVFVSGLRNRSALVGAVTKRHFGSL